MKHISIVTINLFVLLLVHKPIAAQSIEYSFGKGSDVVDSLKHAIEWYKKAYNQSDITKLELFLGIDYCDGQINLSLSQFSGKGKEMKSLIKKSDRYLKVSNKVKLPIVFQTDILATEIKEKIIFINMNGFYIKIEKDEKYVWRVVQMNQTF